MRLSDPINHSWILGMFQTTVCNQVSKSMICQTADELYKAFIVTPLQRSNKTSVFNVLRILQHVVVWCWHKLRHFHGIHCKGHISRKKLCRAVFWYTRTCDNDGYNRLALIASQTVTLAIKCNFAATVRGGTIVPHAAIGSRRRRGASTTAPIGVRCVRIRIRHITRMLTRPSTTQSQSIKLLAYFRLNLHISVLM